MSKFGTSMLNNNGSYGSKGIKQSRLSVEEKLSKYKNRMELVRTVIGLIVLGIQLFIVFKLYAAK